MRATFNIGNVKYAVKYKEMVHAITNHIKREYKGRADIAKAIKELSIPNLATLGYLTVKTGATTVFAGEVILW